MSTGDPFHEAKQALNSARIEFNAVSSLSLASASTPVHACDLAVRVLYTIATNSPFPYDRYKPYHQPGRLVDDLGIKGYYNSDLQRYLDKLEGYALHDARYESTQAYRNYTSSESSGKAKELIEGAAKFIEKTESLSGNDIVLGIIRKHSR